MDKRGKKLLCFTLCCLAIILAAKWFVISRMGVNVPFLDQWDDEVPLYQGFEEGKLSARMLVAPLNEHRPLTTRIWALSLFALNSNTWDVRLQMFANSLLHATALILICSFLGRGLPPRARMLILALGMVFGVLPLAWINTLGGIQSCFYFLLLFSGFSLHWLSSARPLAGKWWLGWLCLVGAMLSVASGVLVVPAVLTVYLLQSWQTRTVAKRQLAAAALLLGTFIVGWHLIPHVPAHDHLRATRVADLLSALAKTLAWPYSSVWLSGVFFSAPWLVLVCFRLLKRDQSPQKSNSLVAFGAWALLSSLAISYSRGRDVIVPMVQHRDLVAVGLIVNAAVLLRLGSIERVRTQWAGRFAWVLAAWLLLLFCGLLESAGAPNGWLAGPAFRHRVTQQMAANVRGYLLTGDARFITDRGPVPYWADLDRMKSMLDDPKVRHILPPSLSVPLDPTGTAPAAGMLTAVSEWLLEFWYLPLILGVAGALMMASRKVSAEIEGTDTE